MIALVLSASLVVAQSAPIKLASPALSGINMTPAELSFYTDHLAQQLGFQGMRVTTPSEIQSLLGFERQKALLGCAEAAASCVAELANALGVDGLVTGSVGRLGKTFQINLKIIKAEDGEPLAAWSGRARSEEELLDKLTEAAKALARELRAKRDPGGQQAQAQSKGEPAPPAPSVEARQAGPLRRFAWIPAAAGGAVGVLGGVLVLQGNGKAEQIRQAPDEPTARALHQEGTGLQRTGAVLLGVGAAALAAGGVMFLMGGEAQVAVVPGPNPGVAVSGTFDLSGGVSR